MTDFSVLALLATRIRLLVLLLLMFFFNAPYAVGAKKAIPVLYPKAKEPYSTIFKDTIRGIEEASRYKIQAKSVDRGGNQAKIHKWLKKEPWFLSTALGFRSLTALQSSGVEIPIVSAASLNMPKDMQNIVFTLTYTPDPDVIFEKFMALSPNTKQIHVVINLERWQWLVEFAEHAATRHKLKLTVYDATNLQASARLYRELLSKINSDHDAIWLPQDSTTLDNEVIMPLILDRLWSKKLKVFSSSLSSVNRGVLLGVYPNNHEMGVYLGGLINQIVVQLESGQLSLEEKIQPLRQLKTAINIRTAKHIDIDVKQELIETFDLVLPKNVR